MELFFKSVNKAQFFLVVLSILLYAARSVQVGQARQATETGLLK